MRVAVLTVTVLLYYHIIRYFLQLYCNNTHLKETSRTSSEYGEKHLTTVLNQNLYVLMLNIANTSTADLHFHVMFEFLEGLIGFGEETAVHIQGLIKRPRARVHGLRHNYIIHSPSQTHCLNLCNNTHCSLNNNYLLLYIYYSLLL